jgi:YggT family protein
VRKFVPPIGGVDISPIIWVGIISLLREILVGQQGLLKLLA